MNFFVLLKLSVHTKMYKLKKKFMQIRKEIKICRIHIFKYNTYSNNA